MRRKFADATWEHLHTDSRGQKKPIGKVSKREVMRTGGRGASATKKGWWRLLHARCDRSSIVSTKFGKEKKNQQQKEEEKRYSKWERERTVDNKKRHAASTSRHHLRRERRCPYPLRERQPANLTGRTWPILHCTSEELQGKRKDQEVQSRRRLNVFCERKNQLISGYSPVW